ncbi:MAG: Superfamily helicase, partial [Myxococcaceae bacterium]|nr:Superfamily helicase [Myxococcaceae bacterium]
MDQALTELSRQLLRAADRSLLDLQLDSLCKRIADEDVRDVLIALHEAGEGDTLRDLLQADRLALCAAETCTAREEDALAAQLRKWLGMGSAGGDDPARLTPIEPPPEDAASLLEWADKHRLTRLLMRPAHEVLSANLGLPSELSLVDVCLGASAGGLRAASLLVEHRAAAEARAYLRGQAAELAALPARERLHRQALPTGALGALARRLRAFVAGTELSELHMLRFVPARPVTLQLEAGTARALIKTVEGARPAQLTLYLSGYPQRALEGSCDTCVDLRCLHLKALAARLLDACLSADDRLHEALVSFVEVPPWRRFLGALSPESASERAASTADVLGFSLRLEGERLSVAALQRRTLADGRMSPGKLVSPHKLARSERTNDRDRAVLAAMIALTRTTAPQYLPVDVTLLRALVEHPELQLDGSNASVRVAEESLQVALLEQPDGLSIKVSLAGAEVQQPARARELHYVLQYDASQ